MTSIFDFDAATTGSSPQGYILQTVADVTGIKPVTTNSMECFPNPASNILFARNVPPSTPYTLTDILGRPVDRGVFTTSQQTIDISKLAPGIYLLNKLRFVKE